MEVDKAGEPSSHETDEPKVCSICDKSIEPDNLRIVKERGIQSLIKASVARKDKKHFLFENAVELKIHKNCQTFYLRQSSIDEAAKKISKTCADRRKELSLGRNFNFSECCFYCGLKVLKTDFSVLRIVNSRSTIQNVLDKIANHQSDYYRAVEARLRNLRRSTDEYFKENDVIYHKTCQNKLYNFKPVNMKDNAKLSENMRAILKFIINYILDNESMSQFSLKEMTDKFEDETDIENYERPRLDRIIYQLEQHFGEEIVVYRSEKTRDYFICYRDTLGNVLEDAWYDAREKDNEKDRQRVVEMAGHIILQDIRTHRQLYPNEYNPPSNFLKDVEEIPKTLKTIIDIIVKTHKKSQEIKDLRLDNQVLTFAHLLASAARPKCYKSSIKLGLSTLIHRKYGVKDLIVLLNNIGLCASYKDVEIFENSVLFDPENFSISPDAYLQFIFDNADHNTATIDGRNTFHAMGGIMCVTPSEAVTSEERIVKINISEIKSLTHAFGTFGFTPVKVCYMNKCSGVDSMLYDDLTKNKDEIVNNSNSLNEVNQFSNIPMEEEVHEDVDKDTDMEIDLEDDVEAGVKLGQEYIKAKTKGESELSKRIEKIRTNALEKLRIEYTDMLWLYGKKIDANTPGWFGFMEKYYQLNDSFEISKVIPLPFVNAPPSDYSTIFTVLIEAAQRAKAHNQKHVCVTFDQPLYWKARDIIASIKDENDPHNLKSIILIIGGFHALMSYLGSIGFIMEGSGLKEAICTIYAELSAEKALTGHAYARSVRSHILIYAALANIILDKIDWTEREIMFLKENLKNIGTTTMENSMGSAEWKNIIDKFELTLSNFEERGPTSKLWVQYFRMVTIMLHYINAQRCGKWETHLECLELMLPFFHASGHNLYAKSTHIFLQDMRKLKYIMDPSEFHKLTGKGYFTIRRSNKYWVGVWSDMTIEQVLMRSMKCVGGLTHGRGLTENVIAKWIACTVAMIDVCNNMENFCGTALSSSEQHVDTRISRISRDLSDLKKISGFFEEFDPFPANANIASIYSGVIGDSEINCYKAHEVGISLQLGLTNQTVGTFTFKKINKIKSLRMITSSIKNSKNEEVPIDPLLIFQRISLNIFEPGDFKNILEYELAPFPLSLFTEGGLRKTSKANFYSEFEPLEQGPISGQKTYVVDGGYFLHRVVWNKFDTVDEIIARYVLSAKKHYVQNSTFVFDGYPDDTSTSTKSVERSRRKKLNVGKPVNIDISNKNTRMSVFKKEFMKNDKNKKQLINLLKPALENSGFFVKVAEEDADTLIVSTALYNAVKNSSVDTYIVGQDIDLLVILTQYVALHQQSMPQSEIGKIFFVKETVDASGRHKTEIYTPHSFSHENLIHLVGFFHIFTGCDTTSAFHFQGKSKVLKCLPLDELKNCVDPFYKYNVDQNILINNSIKIVTNMYSSVTDKKQIKKMGTEDIKLHDLRYVQFTRYSIKSQCKLENLPPTEGALKQHTYRTYLQLQSWLRHFYQTFGSINYRTCDELNPTDWGWKLSMGELVPVRSLDPLVPDFLLKKITCSCKTGCSRLTCGCKKLGLFCTSLCVECTLDTCQNWEKELDILETDDPTDQNLESDFNIKE